MGTNINDNFHNHSGFSAHGGGFRKRSSQPTVQNRMVHGAVNQSPIVTMDGFSNNFGDRFSGNPEDILGGAFGDGFSDDAEDTFGDGFSDDAEDTFGDGFSDDAQDTFGDDFSDDAQDTFGDDFSDGFGDDSGEKFNDNMKLDVNTSQSAHTGKKQASAIQSREMYIALIALLLLSAGFLAFVLFKSKDDSNEEYDALPYPDSSVSDTASNEDNNSVVSQTEEDVPSEEDKPVSSDTTTYKPLHSGDQNSDVKKMQTRLNELGYMSKKSCTGYYGDFTVKTVKLFQSNAKLKATGEADEETLRMLYSENAPSAAGN